MDRNRQNYSEWGTLDPERLVWYEFAYMSTLAVKSLLSKHTVYIASEAR